jgi:hypothetical protein
MKQLTSFNDAPILLQPKQPARAELAQLQTQLTQTNSSFRIASGLKAGQSNECRSRH